MPTLRGRVISYLWVVLITPSVQQVRPALHRQQTSSSVKTRVQTAPANSVNSRRVEWTEQEEQDTRNVLAEFMASLPKVNGTQCDDGNHQPHDVLFFPTRMRGRRRKLVHALAQEMGLAHWCLGRKHAEKTVAVAAKGRRRPHTTEPHDTSIF
jgi:hypothetical protein